MNTTVKSIIALALFAVCSFAPGLARAESTQSSTVPALSTPSSLQAPGTVRPYGYPMQLEAPPKQTITKSYGLQILAADAAAWALIAATESETAVYGVFLGGPMVHLMNGEGGRALGSLGVRVAAPLGLATLFVASCENGENDGWDCLEQGIGGLALGYVGAVVFDAAVLAKKEVEVEQPRFAPMVSVNENSASIGLGGRF